MLELMLKIGVLLWIKKVYEITYDLRNVEVGEEGSTFLRSNLDWIITLIFSLLKGYKHSSCS